LAAIAVIMIAVQIVNSASGGSLNAWGIRPRHLSGLAGIVFAPWLHGGWGHLLNNLSVLLVLGWLVMLDSLRKFIVVSAFIIVIGGLLLWMFGRPFIHIGASGWVFGLWAWLLANACFQRRPRDILIAVVVLMFYGGLWYGLLPQGRVSFEGHIAGLVAGVACSWWRWRK